MYYLHIDDLRVSLLCQADTQPNLVGRNIIPGAFAEVLADFSSAFRAKQLDVLVSGPTTIVPTAELNVAPEKQDLIFNSCFNFLDNSPRRVFFDEIPALHSHLLFAVKDNVCNEIIEQFSEAEIRFTSALTPLLRHFSDQYDGKRRFRVYLNCRYRFIDVFAFDGRQLVVLNSFPVNAVSDAVYYTLSFSKVVGLDVATVPYYVVGDHTMSKTIVEQLSAFAHNVCMKTLEEEFGTSPLTTNPEIPYALSAHILCAS